VRFCHWLDLSLDSPSTAHLIKCRPLFSTSVGAGPTGVEFASELRDFIEQDGTKYYSQLLKYVKIKVIEASPSILAPFDASLREAAAAALTRKTNRSNGLASNLLPEDLTELITNKKVEQITDDRINLNDGKSIPYGLAVWAGGIGPLPITLSIIDAIGGRQLDAQKVARGKIAVDPWLRAFNGKGRIFALGDCSCTQGSCLPTTAQVAAQEGEFLAHMLNTANLATEFEETLLLPPRKYPNKNQLCDSIASWTTKSNEYMAPFQFFDMGILAYTGQNSALAQVQADHTLIKAKGYVGFGLWRSVYFMKQASMRNRFMVGIDWIKACLFGRDITLID
jgi:NADH dehydrogenase FAD-containing subunit